jgi:O-antigen/teichoic acid export membrane protein
VPATIWNPLAYLLLAVNRHELFTYVFLVGALVALTLTYVLVRHLGVTGAAAANLLFDLAMSACGFILVRRLTGPFPLGPSTIRILIPQHSLRAALTKLSPMSVRDAQDD